MTQVAFSFSSDADSLAAASDAELLQNLLWERGADPALRSAAATGDMKTFVAACQQKAREGFGDDRPVYSAMILWSQAAFPGEAELAPLLEEAAGVVTTPQRKVHRPANKATRNLAQRVESLVFALTGEPQTINTDDAAFALAACLEILVDAGPSLRPQQYWRLWRYSLIKATQLTRDLSPNDDPTVAEDIKLLEHGELPLLAGLVFSGIAGASERRKAGRKAMSQALSDNIDTDGTPHADLVERLPLWLAPLVRATRSARRFDVRLWTPNQELLMKSIIERTAPFCRPDGRAALSNGLKLKAIPVLEAAAELFGLSPQDSATSYLQSVKRIVAGKPPTRRRPSGVMSMPSSQSDFARLAMLRSDWSVDAHFVALAHHRKFPQLDATISGRPLFHGDWELHLKIGGTPVELAEEWSCICWQSDPDADYIELQMIGPGKLRVERIVMLSRTQKFLLLADCVCGVAKERIEYQSRLPLGDHIQGRVDTETREAQLLMKGLRARVFPLALPQERVHSTPHSFTVGDGHMTLTQTAVGEGLFAPILMEWDPTRMRAPAQWRSLTVTEESKVIGNDIAAGHRLKVSDLHLLVFRSLKAGESRAVLGHHTWNETVVARIDKKGDVDPILMVEP